MDTQDQTGRHTVELDPFDYVRDKTSAIRGLQGDADPTDPFHVFHSHYVGLGAGRVDVDIAFTRLRSRKDRLMVSVHSLDRRTEQLVVVMSESLSLRTLAASGGTATLTFDARADLDYAVLGRTMTPCEATAAGLALRCHVDPDRIGERSQSAGKTDYRPKDMRNVATLLCNRPASLAAPMSQACTAPQLREPVFADWQRQAGLSGAGDRFQWETVFVLQVLKLFGVIDAKANGLAFGTHDGPVAQVLQAAGCTTTSATALAEDAAAGRDADAEGEPDGYESPVALPPPSAMRSYDFLWSTGLCDVVPSTTDMIYLIEDTIEYLKPGGMAVHMLSATIGQDDEVPAGAGPATFSRNALAQLSLAVVGGKHEIAQMNLHTDPDDGGIQSYGVIIRKG